MKGKGKSKGVVAGVSMRTASSVKVKSNGSSKAAKASPVAKVNTIKPTTKKKRG